ncbi:substrate-binding domain-containing protein [Arthrobacter sp. B0490]|uniref:sugar ABC transporter substrate-binding protein n=1 Tax=Arthrobacter sp. B0490 TaxID=2058891 RepID=UPI0015E43C4F|nr:substrate-binding domain-containing protein [Arthrobacter sp. B0490]
MFALGACGAGGGGSSGGGESSSGAPGSSAALEEVLSQEFEFPYPEEPTTVDGDRTISYILGGFAAGGASEVAQERLGILQSSGWTVEGPLDGKFTPSAQATLIEQAVLKGVDGIVLDFIFPSQVSGAIDSARAAGIPVVCNICAPEESSEGVYVIGATVETSVEKQTELVLAALDKPDATIAVVTDAGNAIVGAANDIQIPLLKEGCPDCNVVEVTYTLADLAKPVAASYANLLREYPAGSLDAVITPFTAAATPLVRLAEQSGRDDFKIFNTYGDAPSSTQIKEGEFYPLLYGDTMVSQNFVSYADVDTLARVFNSQPVVAYNDLPIAPITGENADRFVNDDGRWVPDGLEEKFSKVWEMNG